MAHVTRVSENGWPVLDTAPPTLTIPGTTVKVRVRPGDVATVLCYVAARFDDEVEDLDTAGHPFDPAPAIAGGGPSGEPDDWGWAVRNVRGSATVISNHSSGTALDLNATQHPRGVHGTFTAVQVRAMRRILDDPILAKVVRWGEDYNSTVDGMHVEINDGERSVAQAAARIRAAQTPKTPEEDVPLTSADVAKILSTPLGHSGPTVGVALQTGYANTVKATGELLDVQATLSATGERLTALEAAVARVEALLAPPPVAGG